MAEPMTEENASSWYDDTPITDEQYASVWDSAMAVQERPSYSRHVVRKLLAKVDRLSTQAAYMRDQIEQQAQVIEERKTQTVAYKALAEEHQKRGDKLSARLAEHPSQWEVRRAYPNGNTIVLVGLDETQARCDVTGWLKLANLTVRIEQISRACPDGGPVRESWQWTCKCHGRVSTPWPERPTELNAQAEHDLLFGMVRS